MIFFSFFAAGMLSATSFLQAEASWWKGPLATLVLVLAGFVLLIGVPEEALTNTILPPVASLTSGFWLCATIVGAGTLLALTLRRRLSTGKIAGVSFLGGLVVFNILTLVI